MYLVLQLNKKYRETERGLLICYKYWAHFSPLRRSSQRVFFIFKRSMADLLQISICMQASSCHLALRNLTTSVFEDKKEYVRYERSLFPEAVLKTGAFTADSKQVTYNCMVAKTRNLVFSNKLALYLPYCSLKAQTETHHSQ